MGEMKEKSGRRKKAFVIHCKTDKAIALETSLYRKPCGSKFNLQLSKILITKCVFIVIKKEKINLGFSL